jgi:hypothetical protein
MTIVTNFGSGYSDAPGRITGYGTVAWLNPSYCMAEDGSTALATTRGMFYPMGIYGFYWNGTYQGPGTSIFSMPTVLSWSDACPAPSIPTPAYINGNDFGIGIYYNNSTQATKDIWTNTYGFSIPSDATVLEINGYFKHRSYLKTTGIYPVNLDAMKIAVDYTEASSAQSPSSNGYSSGPMMFKSPFDILRVLKKPKYCQIASPRSVCQGIMPRRVCADGC